MYLNIELEELKPILLMLYLDGIVSVLTNGIILGGYQEFFAALCY
jgi:hypothetical protein